MMGIECEHFFKCVFEYNTPRSPQICVFLNLIIVYFQTGEMPPSSLAARKVALFHWINAVDSCKFGVLYIKDLEVP